MELSKYTKYKLIKNGALPKYNEGLMSGILGGISTLAGIYKSANLANNSVDQLVSDAPTALRTVMGVPYTVKIGGGHDYSDSVRRHANMQTLQNTISGLGTGLSFEKAAGKNLEDLFKKKTVNTEEELPSNKCGKLPHHILGGIIGAGLSLVGSMIAGNASENAARELERRRDQLIGLMNRYSNTIAKDEGIQQLYAMQNGDMRSLNLYSHYCGGKLPKHSLGGVQGPYGWMKDPQEGWGEYGEYIGLLDDNGNLIAGHVILPKNGKMPKRAKGKVDTVPIWEDENTFILPVDITKKFLKTGDLNMALAETEQRQLNAAKKGQWDKLPHHELGGLLIANILGHGLGVGMGLHQIADSKYPKMYNDNIRIGANPYLNDMFSIRTSLDPVVRHSLNQQAKGFRSVDMSGGLNPSQKALAKASIVSNTQNNLADAVIQALNANNQIRFNANAAGIQSKQADRQFKAEHEYRNRQLNSQAASNANALRYTGMAGITNSVLSAIKNYYSMYMGDKTYKLYADQNEQEKQKILALANMLNNSKYTNQYSTGSDWASKYLPVPDILGPDSRFLYTPWGLRAFSNVLANN